MKVWCSGWKKQRRISRAKSPDDWKTSPGKLNNWEQCGRLNYRCVGGGGAYCSSRENVNTVTVQHFLLWIPDISPPLCASKSTLSLHVTSCIVQAAEHVVKQDCHPLQAGSMGAHQVGTSITEGCGVEPMFRVFSWTTSSGC